MPYPLIYRTIGNEFNEFIYTKKVVEFLLCFRGSALMVKLHCI